MNTGQVASASLLDHCVKSAQSLGFRTAPGKVGLAGGVVLTGGVTGGGVVAGGFVGGGLSGGAVGVETQPPSNKASRNKPKRMMVMDFSVEQNECGSIASLVVGLMRIRCKGVARFDWFQLKQNITGDCDGMVVTRSGNCAWVIDLYCVVYLAEERQEGRPA